MKNNQGMNSVAVLMSTYNGEQYLEEQIESILAQEDVKVDLYVRDDGSSDSTLEILRRYAETKDNVHFIDDHEHFGPQRSFFELLYRVDGYPYYAFADQDDIWKPQKLAVAIRKVEKFENHIPCLYCSNQTIFMEGSEKGLRFRQEPNHDLASLLYQGEISGCTMVLNAELRNYIACTNRLDEAVINLRMHDVWMQFYALLIGKVIYDHNSYIDYRIHEKNTVGVPEVSDYSQRIARFYESMKKRIIRVVDSSRRNHAIMNTVKALLENIDDISMKDKSLLLKYVHYKRSLRDKIALLLDQRIRDEMGPQWWGFAIRVIMNWI